jgi:hypothetical protein
MHDFPDPLSANDAQRDPQIAKVSQVIERLTHDAAKSLAKDYEGQLTTIKTAKLRLADAQKALAEGQKLFSDRNWIGTTDKLVPVKQQLQELLRQLTQPAPEPWQDRLTDEAKTARDEAETLIKRAEFCRQGDPLRERVNHENDGPPEKWAPLVRDLRPVVGMGPPSPTDTELFAWLQRALKSLEARDALYRLSLQPACPLRPWLDKLKPILANADKFAEDYAKTILPEVLKRSLPEKRSADEGFREAVTVDGEVLVGTWQETGIGYYHFRRRGADIDETWLSKKLKQTPTEPLAVRCGKQYNPALEKLFEQLGDRGIWDGFLTLCQSLQGDLAQRGEVAGGVSFHKEIKFAQEVLASWADIEPFLRP